MIRRHCCGRIMFNLTFEQTSSISFRNTKADHVMVRKKTLRLLCWLAQRARTIKMTDWNLVMIGRHHFELVCLTERKWIEHLLLTTVESFLNTGQWPAMVLDYLLRVVGFKPYKGAAVFCGTGPFYGPSLSGYRHHVIPQDYVHVIKEQCPGSKLSSG